MAHCTLSVFVHFFAQLIEGHAVFFGDILCIADTFRRSDENFIGTLSFVNTRNQTRHFQVTLYLTVADSPLSGHPLSDG